MEERIPIACVSGAIPAAERAAHFSLLARLFREAVRERREIPGGYAFRFESEALEEVARFVARERLCCPFLGFALEVPPGGGPLWLRITGPDGARALFDAELSR